MSNFNIVDYLDNLTVIKETPTDYHCNCPVCGSGGFKIDKNTGKYNTFKCGCMDTFSGKQAVIKAVNPEQSAPTLSNKKHLRPKQSRTFYYRDKLGNPSLTVKRTDHGNGQPKIIKREPSGIPTKTIRPYLSERLESIVTEGKVSIFISEGEPKSEVLNAMFPTWVATNGLGGKWINEHTDYVVDLGYSDVILCPDKDTTGLSNMVKVAQQFLKRGVSCHWVLPDTESWRSLPEKDGTDIVDWLEDGVSAHDVMMMTVTADSLPDWLLELINPPLPPSRWASPNIHTWLTMSEKEQDFWLIDDFLSLGSNMLFGKSGQGKSVLGTQMALAVALGKDFLGKKVKPGKVVYHTSDEPERVLKFRCNKNELGQHPNAGNFIPLIKDVDGNKWSINHIDGLEELFVKHKPVLFVLDSLRSAIVQGAGVKETDEDIGQYVTILRDLCDKYGVSLLMIHHPRKGIDGDALDGVCGHNSITSPLDCIWLIKPDLSRGKDARKMTLIKSRIGEDRAEINLMLDPYSLTFDAPIPHNPAPSSESVKITAEQQSDRIPENPPTNDTPTLKDRVKIYFKYYGETPKTVKQCFEYLQAHTDNLPSIRKCCDQLVKSGHLEVIPATVPKQYKFTGVNKDD